MLEGESPIFIQDEAAGEQQEVSREHLKRLIAANLPLLSLLFDMDSGLIRVSMSEYDGLSHKFMQAWYLYKQAKAEKKRSEEPGNPVSPHPPRPAHR